jgi:NAD(P)-dependent dehydrogenase (short-subunit alcohol dehydrogenase family)
VPLGARNLNAGEEAASSLRNTGLNIEPVPASIDAAVEHIEKSGRQIDALINNAGVLHQNTGP